MNRTTRPSHVPQQERTWKVVAKNIGLGLATLCARWVLRPALHELAYEFVRTLFGG